MNASLLEQYEVREGLSDFDLSVASFTTTLADRDTLSRRERIVHIVEVPKRKSLFTIEGESEEPAWRTPTLGSMGELLSLRANWDSYGAPPTNPWSVVAALQFLFMTMQQDTPAPAVVPTSRGSVQLEWHTRGIDLEIQIESPGRMHVSYENSERGIEWEGEITSDLEPLAKCIHELSRRT